MNDKEKQKLEIYKNVYALHLTNPELSYQQLSERTGVHRCTVSRVIMRFEEIEGTNEPFFHSRGRKNPPKRISKPKYKSTPTPLNPKVKNPDAMWEKAGVCYG